MAAMLIGFDFAVREGFLRILGDPPAGAEHDRLADLLREHGRGIACARAVLAAAWRAALVAVAEGRHRRMRALRSPPGVPILVVTAHLASSDVHGEWRGMSSSRARATPPGSCSCPRCRAPTCASAIRARPPFAVLRRRSPRMRGTPPGGRLSTPLAHPRFRRGSCLELGAQLDGPLRTSAHRGTALARRRSPTTPSTAEAPRRSACPEARRAGPPRPPGARRLPDPAAPHP